MGGALTGLARAWRASPDARQRASALAFVCANERAVAGELVQLEDLGPEGITGWAVIDRERPLVWDANYLWVQRAGAADAVALTALAEQVQGSVGLAHRLVLVADEAAGATLTPGFLELGWKAAPYVVMAHRHERLLGDAGPAREASQAEVAAARRVTIAAEPWGSAEVAEQINARDALIDAVAAGRYFAADCEGVVASHCQLWSGEGVAQVENVATERGYRNRGLARAVVSLATAAGRARAELVFLLADASDWPQHLYRRLGFESVGLLHRFAPRLPG